MPEAPTAAVLASTMRADATVLGALGEREAADLVLGRLDDLTARDPDVANVRLPYAFKGLRRAALSRDPRRAR